MIQNITYPKSTGQDNVEQLYFAYGSNMNTAQMDDRCKTSHKGVGPAKLINY